MADHHGQGNGTSLKERSFAAVLSISMRIMKKPQLAPHPYFHVDLHAGPGWNDQRHCPGSPKVFLDIAAQEGRTNYHAWFVDKNANHVERLCQTVLAGNERCYPIVGDNAGVLPIVAAFIRQCGEKQRFATGSIIVDPNGYFDDVPFDALQAFTREFRRMDVVLNLNVRTKRLGEAHIAKGTMGWVGKRWPDLRELPGLLDRRYEFGLIQERSYGGDPFVTMILRNMETGAYPALGLFKLTSPQGRRILEQYGRDKDAPRQTVLL